VPVDTTQKAEQKTSKMGELFFSERLILLMYSISPERKSSFLLFLEAISKNPLVNEAFFLPLVGVPT
jgi:hypothetical protein